MACSECGGNLTVAFGEKMGCLREIRLACEDFFFLPPVTAHHKIYHLLNLTHSNFWYLYESFILAEGFCFVEMLSDVIQQLIKPS